MADEKYGRQLNEGGPTLEDALEKQRWNVAPPNRVTTVDFMTDKDRLPRHSPKQLSESYGAARKADREDFDARLRYAKGGSVKHGSDTVVSCKSKFG